MAGVVGDGPDGPVLVLVCSDGAGSAAHSATGSQLACHAIMEKAARFVEAGAGVAALTDHTLRLWFEYAADTLHFQATVREHASRDYACTLLVTLIDDSGSAYAQLGDGVIVISEGEGYRPVFWPQSGEYANTTFFITAPEHQAYVQVERRPGRVDEVALLTDGLQMLALRYADLAAHEAFFRPMFERLRYEPVGEAEMLRDPLTEFLSSPSVNTRTDDDKTLLIATRRSTALIGSGIGER